MKPGRNRDGLHPFWEVAALVTDVTSAIASPPLTMRRAMLFFLTGKSPLAQTG